VGSNLIIENNAVATAPTSVPVFRMKLEFDYTPTGGQPVTFTTEQNQTTQQWIIPLPSGTTVSNVQVDPRRWTLTQVIRTRRDNTLGVTGLADEGIVTRVSVYPNPCTDFLTVPTATKTRTAEVLDLAGRVVRRTTLAATAEHLPTAALASGSYLLRLTDAAGAVQVARFSKQ
jgi:Secretion system C-terminal sorting domain